MLGEHVDYESLARAMSGGGPVYLTHWSAEEIDLAPVGRISTAAIDPTRESFTFDRGIQLQPVAVDEGDGSLAVRLLWHMPQPVSDDINVFVHLYGADGVLLTQDDGYPIAGMAPFWLWPAGQTLEDRRVLELPAGSGGGLTIGIGLYDPATGARLALVDGQGSRLPDDMLRIPVTTAGEPAG